MELNIQALRADAVAARRDELEIIVQSRKRKLQELYAVARHVERSKPFPPADVILQWGLRSDLSRVLDDKEKRFLDENDIEMEVTLPGVSTSKSEHPSISASPASSPAAERGENQVSFTQPASTVGKSFPVKPSQRSTTPQLVSESIRTRAPSPSLPTPIKTNGHVSHKASPVAQAKEDPVNSYEIPCTPSPTERKAPSLPPATDTIDAAAPVVDIGGIPVLQTTSTTVPDQRERAAGVHPPPPPPEMAEDAPISARQSEASPSASQPSKVQSEGPSANSPSVPSTSSTPRRRPTPRPSNLVLEIPDSQTSTVPPASTPPSSLEVPSIPPISATLPPQQPLLSVSTGPKHTASPPSPVKTQPEASSPASSVDIGDVSTPGNIISSATSPDAHQLPEPKHNGFPESDRKEVGDEKLSRPISTNQQAMLQEKTPNLSAGEVKSLPSVAVTNEVSQQEREVDVPLPTVPSTQLSTGSALQQEQNLERELPEPLSSPGAEPISPDPSAQLRLENQLANGEIHSSEIPPLSLKSKALSPRHPNATVPEQSPTTAESVKRGTVAESDGDEDRVHLVGDKPLVSAVESTELTSPSQQPSPEVNEVQSPGPKQEANVPVATNGEARLTETAVQPSVAPVSEPVPERMDIDTEESQSIPQRSSVEIPDSVLIPVDDGRPEDGDTAMEDAAVTIPSPKESVDTEPPKPQPTLKQTLGTPVPHPSTPVKSPDTREHLVEREEQAAVSSENTQAAQQAGAVAIATAPSTPQPSSPVKEPSDLPQQSLPTPPEPQEKDGFVRPALFARAAARHKASSSRSGISKVVISSAHHAAAAAEAEAKRLREDQERQGLIVVARRRTQQAAAGSARRPSVFPPGSVLEQLTKYTVEDDTPKEPKTQDYLDTLYTIKSYPSVEDLLRKASKAVTTENHNLARSDRIAVKVLSRIQELQEQGLWSLRQIVKAPEPPRKKAHWDYLLGEMAWLATDFREERKLKIAQAKQLVGMVMEWHQSSPEQRLALVVDRKVWGRVPKGLRQQLQQEGERSTGNTNDHIKEEQQDDEAMDTPHHTYDHIKEPPPAAVFSLEPNETIFCMPRTKVSEETLEQLPLYAPPRPPVRVEYVEERWSNNALIPVTKYSTGRMVFKDEDKPPRKRCRYEYNANFELFADESDEEGEVVSGGSAAALDPYGRPRIRDRTSRPLPLHPEQNNVALFRPEFKPMLQRIRTHVFRLPTDQPPQSYFEQRTPSLWTVEEDDKLRLLVKEYNHNWQFIATYMNCGGEFNSGADRRSQWECFERWLAIENVPQEFTKSPYYKGVQQRLEIAQRSSQNFINATAAGQQVNPLKRRGTIPMKTERKRNSRALTQFDAMRKLAKKRETSQTKQAQSNRAALAAAMRKQSSPNPNSQMRTPQYFSNMKFEKDEKAKEQSRLLSQMNQMGAAARNAGPGAAQQAARLPNGVPINMANRIAVPVGAGPNGQAIPNQYPVAGIRHPAALPGQGRAQRSFTQQEIQAIRLQQLQMRTHQAALQAQAGQIPSQADIVARFQAMHPNMSHAEATLQAQKQLALYHAHLTNTLQAQARRPSAAPRSTGTGGTGVLIGANGPIGPGADRAAQAMVAQQQQQQQQQAQQAQQVQQPHQPQQQQQQQQPQQPQQQPQQQQAQPQQQEHAYTTSLGQ